MADCSQGRSSPVALRGAAISRQMNAPSPVVAPSETPFRVADVPVRRTLGIVLVAAYFILGALFLLVREVALPRVGQYRAEIAAVLERAIGLPVSIDALSADWSGLRPRLHLAGLHIRDREGRPALQLGAVDATLAWSSLARGQAHFHRLELHAPTLALRREADGQIFVAGVPLDPDASGSGFSDWLLAQREIVIRDAALSWSDALRGAPELRLDDVDFRLARAGGRYRFGLHARPPDILASTLDLRGDVVSARPSDPVAWAGQLYLALDRADLGGWQAWLDYPLELAGQGGVRAWIGLSGGEVRALTSNVALDDVTTRLAPSLPELDLTRVRGQLSARRGPEGLTFATRGLEVDTGDGVHIAPTDIELALDRSRSGAPSGGRLQANHLDFSALARLAGHLPFDERLRERLAGFAPQGRLDDLRLEWQGAPAAPETWKVHTRFSGLALTAQGVVPGVVGLAGEIDGDHTGGRYRLAGQDAVLDLPAVFPEPRLAFAALRAEGGWGRRDSRLEIVLDAATFENPDAAGSAAGRYVPIDGGRGEIDLSARLTRADSESVWRYLPKVVNEATRHWLRDSLTGGTVPEARLRLKGNLDHFPFVGGQSGQFLVTTRVSGASLAYAAGWPAITGIDAELRFEGPAMRINASRGTIFGVALSGVTAEVPQLNAPGGELMTIRGRASGPTADFLRFVSESPVSGRIDRFTEHMRAEGRGNLDLTLVMPLHHSVDTTVKGEFRFAGNRITVVDGLPPLADAAGTVQFTERELAIRDARARAFGEPLVLSAHTPAEGGVSFAVAGGANVQALRQAYDWPVLEHLSGTAPWQATIDVRKPAARLNVRADLGGIASSLPAPMNKSATMRWPLEIDVGFPDDTHQEIRLRVAERLALDLVRRQGDSGWEVERGGVGLFAPVSVPAGGRGVHIAAQLDALDVDAWRRVFDHEGGERAGDEQPLPIAGLDLQAREVRAFGQTLKDVHVAASAAGAGWTGRIASDAAEGEFDWRSPAEGALRARFKHLVVGGAGDAAGDPQYVDDAQPPRRLPALDIVAERFALRGMELGRLEARAYNRGGQWHLDSVALANPDGRLSGAGRWVPGEPAQTELDFRLEADDIGRFLTRVGYAEAVRGGRAVLAGKLDWHGAPTRIHYPSLSGAFTLEAHNGQFRQLEPGVGRLLGVLSLQSLPRRLTLDFRDVLSEGFAFDRISGTIAMAAGVARTDDLQIRGPAARILMRGSADLEHETQDLRVSVQPTLSESVAIGAAAGLINPVAGVVTYFAQKALSDPIERLFAFDYAVTGSWSDPKVEKRSVAPFGAKSQPDEDK